MDRVSAATSHLDMLQVNRRMITALDINELIEAVEALKNELAARTNPVRLVLTLEETQPAGAMVVPVIATLPIRVHVINRLKSVEHDVRSYYMNAAQLAIPSEIDEVIADEAAEYTQNKPVNE
jgi:hypothetical protein